MTCRASARQVTCFLAKRIVTVIVLLPAAMLLRGDDLFAPIEQMLGYVRTEQAVIAGIAVGSTEKQVLDALGKPPEMKDLPSGRDKPKKVRLYRYPGVDVELTGGKVSVVRCTASRYATPDGVRVGDTLFKMLRVYLTTKIEITGDDRVAWYGVMKVDAYLVFRLKGTVVSEIELCGSHACERLPQ